MTKSPTPANEVVCSGCFHLIDLIVGKVVAGWERARFVTSTPGDYLCVPCKEPIIESLSRSLPV